MGKQKVGRQIEKANTKKIGTEKLDEKLIYAFIEDFMTTAETLLCAEISGRVKEVRITFTYPCGGSYKEFDIAFNCG